MGQSALIARRRALAARGGAAIDAVDGSVTHAQLGARSAAVARALLGGRGSLGGERVALLACPSVAWVSGFFGVIEAGGVVVPLSPLHPPAELSYIASDSGAELTLVDGEHAGRAPTARAARLEGLGEAAHEGLPGGDDGDGALLLYTSGTTGKPKGAVLTHGNLAAQAGLIGQAWGVHEGDRLLHALPLHHMHGVVIALLTALSAGASVELLPRFEAEAVWEALGRSSVWMGVPTMYHKLLDALEQASGERARRWGEHARALRLATSGSAALPATLAARWGEVAGQIPLERFGMTEVGVALSNPLGGGRKVGHVGPALPGVEARVLGEAGRPVAPGEAGEVVVRGPTVFAGYLGREDETARAFTSDGWFRTGDTATVDHEGYVKILGRTSVDILKSGGYKLSALEIEEALREHPAVAEVAVVGLPDEAWGERVAAVVVLRGALTQPVTEETLRAFCRENLAPYKVPRVFKLTAELPKNALGKVLKPSLVRWLQSGS